MSVIAWARSGETGLCEMLNYRAHADSSTPPPLLLFLKCREKDHLISMSHTVKNSGRCIANSKYNFYSIQAFPQKKNLLFRCNWWYTGKKHWVFNFGRHILCDMNGRDRCFVLALTGKELGRHYPQYSPYQHHAIHTNGPCPSLAFYTVLSKAKALLKVA